METSHILIDTSIIVEHLRKRNKHKSILYRLVDSYELSTSTMVEFELFAGATDERKRQDLLDVLPLCHILPFTSEIAQRAASIYQELKQQNQIIEVGDIIIAATALYAELPLMTLNVEHFQRIKNICIHPTP